MMMAWCVHFFALTAVALSLLSGVVFKYFIQTGWDRYHSILDTYPNDGLYIVGEVDVTSDPRGYAEQYLQELNTVLSVPVNSSWTNEPLERARHGDLSIASIKVVGPYSDTHTPVHRAFWTMSDCVSAKALYSFLVSPDGFSVIDPVSRTMIT